MVEIAVSARQIKTLDEITLDKQAAKASLEIAIQYHSNILNELTKKEIEWWKEMKEIHNLDPDKQYRTDMIGSCLCIKEVEEKV